MGFIFFKPQFGRSTSKLSKTCSTIKKIKSEFSHFTPLLILVICVQLLLASHASAVSSFFTETDWSSGNFASSSLNTDLSTGQAMLDSNYSHMSYLFDPTTQDNISSMAVLNGKLYMGACQNIYVDTYGAVYSYDYLNDHSQLEYTTTDYGLEQLSVINNQLMVPGADTAAGVNTDESLYLFNGSAWQKKQNIHNALHTDGIVTSFNNKLYVQSLNGPQHNRIQSSSNNGDTWTDERVQNSSQYWHSLLGEYNGQLWLSCLNEANTTQVGIEGFDGNTWAFHQVAQTGNVYTITRMISFNGRSYLGCDSKANISSVYSMDTNGTINAIPTFSFPVRTITQGFCVYDGKLFVSGIKDPLGTPSAFLYYTEDGTNWVTVSNTIPATTNLRGSYLDRKQLVHPLAGYAGRLFMGTTDSARVYVADVETSGELISNEHEISQFNRLQLTWNANIPNGTSIKFQIRCADTSANLASKPFIGPDGTSSTYFDTSGESISGLEACSYTQYKIFMSTSDARYTPYLNDITVTGSLETVDNEPPTTTITTSPAAINGANGWFKTSATITLSSSEPGTTYYQWDSVSGSWATYSAPLATQTGQHTLYYYSKDTNNNSEVQKSLVIKTDTTLPTATISSPSNGASVSGSVDVIGTVNDANISSYSLKYGSGEFPATWTTISSGSNNVSNEELGVFSTSGLSNGIYTLKLTASDLAGNSSLNLIQVTVNNSAQQGGGSGGGGGGSGGGGGGGASNENGDDPNNSQKGLTLVKINNGEKFTNSDRVTLKFMFSAKPVSVMLSNDNTQWSQPEQYEDTKMWHLSPGDGEKTVYAKFQITTSGWSQPVNANIILDSKPPTLSVTADEVASIAALDTASDKKFAIKANTNDESGISKVEFYLDERLIATDGEFPYENSLLASSSNKNSTIKVIAYDNAGNKAILAKPLFSNSDETFRDIPSDFWATQYIEKLNQEGIIGGFADGSFRPDENISRAEFAKMIVKAMGWTLIKPDQPSFSDIPESHWCYSYIETAKTHGVIDGYRDGEFKPNRNITRAEISKMTASAANLGAVNKPASFRDVPESFWAYDYIVAAKENNIVSGYKDGAFRPTSNATRAEAVKMIWALVNS